MKITLVIITTLLVVWYGVEARSRNQPWKFAMNQRPSAKYYLNIESMKLKTIDGMVTIKLAKDHNSSVPIEPKGIRAQLPASIGQKGPKSHRGGIVPVTVSSNITDIHVPRGTDKAESVLRARWIKVLPQAFAERSNVTVVPPIHPSPVGLGPRAIHTIRQQQEPVPCGRTITLNGGQTEFIESKNFPNKYPKNHKCKWVFKLASPDDTLSILCDDFTLQSSKNCKKDYLQINDQKLCGTKPPILITTREPLTINFKTDKKKHFRGFQCEVYAESPPTEPPTAPPNSGDPACGRVNRGTRIVGGVETEVHEYPWQVALYDALDNHLLCGGTIISKCWVITAAHCVGGLSASEKVLIGSHDLNWFYHQKLLGVSKIIVHPDYDSLTLDSDIALLQLADPIMFPADNTVAPACMPIAGELYEDVDAIVTGWGAVSEGGSISNVLQEVTVPTWTNADCSNVYDGITDTMICAGDPEGGKDSCQGDSGGPMVTNNNTDIYSVIGVVSWGSGCARPGVPGVYARVTAFIDWIAEETDKECSCDCNTEPPPTPPTPEPPSPDDCPDCGQVNRVTRIVGGVETEVNEYPWQVGLAYSSSNPIPWCGGSMISEQWVLSAAHCTEGEPASALMLIIGGHNWLNPPAQNILASVSEIKQHPLYNSNTYDSDISLLKLAAPVTFPDNNLIAPACLPTPGELYVGVDATVTGWGTTSYGGSLSYYLQEVTVPIVSNAACNNVYGQITSNMICAGTSEGGKDSCQGDSGGPLVTNVNGKWKLIGIVSFGYKCGEPDIPGVYTRVSAFVDWIAQETGEECLGGWNTEPPPPPTPEPPTPEPPTPEPPTPEPPTPDDCPDCGRANRVTRIVGGQEVEMNEYPWQVALTNPSGSFFFCGGTIIDSLWVITAAHCTASMTTSNKVLIGGHDKTSYDPANLVGIVEIWNHPNYNSGTLDNDVAMLKLASPIQFPDDNTIAPACLPTSGEQYVGVDVTITGWGALSEGGGGPNILNEVTVPTLTNSDCNSDYGGGITSNMICAGVPEGGKDSCQGDSGGPMVYNDNGKWRLVGIVSWGTGCARPGYPGVYARVTEFLDWISTTTAESCLGGNGGVGPTQPPPPPPTPDPTCQCGIPNRSTRIVGGMETEVNEYPWMVALVTTDFYYVCGASIISDEWVLTTAFCAQELTIDAYVFVGDHDLFLVDETPNGYAVLISEIIPHFDYNDVLLSNDIALLRVYPSLEWPGDNTIAPVCLPLNPSEPYEAVDATVTGWGYHSSGGPFVSQLYEVTVPTMINSDCNSIYNGQISDSMMCAGLPDEGKDICNGDAGGPLVYMNGGNYEEIGVVSSTVQCGELGYPGIYSRVTYFLPWIESVIASSNRCSR